MMPASQTLGSSIKPITYIHVVDLITTDEDKRFAPAGRTASAIIEVMRENGGCLPQDLNEKGFLPEEVTQHWHMAKSLAAVEMKLMSGIERDMTFSEEGR